MFFVDAAHFVLGTYLCCLWSFTRIFVRAASGRQRFNVLGAWNAVTRELIAVTNTTVVNTETMCELLRKVASVGLVGPITLVLDNARYQRNAVVQDLAKDLGITLMFLPSYSPNLNLIERLWKFIKRRSLYGRYHPTFAGFRAAIEETLDRLSTTHADQLETLMTLNFQQFKDVSLMAAYGRGSAADDVLDSFGYERHGKASLGDESSRQPFSRRARCARSCEGRPGPKWPRNSARSRRHRSGRCGRSSGSCGNLASGSLRSGDMPRGRAADPGGVSRSMASATGSCRDRSSTSSTSVILRFGSILASSPRLLDVSTSFAGTPGRGVSEAVAIAVKLSREDTRAFASSDIKDFFPRVPRGDVVDLLKAHVEDKDFVELFEAALVTEIQNRDDIVRWLELLFPLSEVGVAQGSLLSVLVANLSLRHFDACLNVRPLTTIRYRDDFAIFGPNLAAVSAGFEVAGRAGKVGHDVLRAGRR